MTGRSTILLSFAVLLIIGGVDLHGAVRRVFIGSLAKKTDVDISIVTLADGEIVGATYYPKPGAPNRYLVPLRDIYRLTGSRSGDTITLAEQRSGSEGATIVARIVKNDLRGTWRAPGSQRAVPFDFWEVFAPESPLLNDTRTSWPPLGRMHDALRAGKLDVAEAEARLACAVGDEGCLWVGALPFLAKGMEPPPAQAEPWRGYLLYVQGKIDEAIAEGRERCALYAFSHSACLFLADLAPRLTPFEERAMYADVCRWQRIDCDRIFGKTEIALAEAAEEGDVARVEEILKTPVNVNFGSESRHSPLFSATEANSAPIVKMLLDHGADPNQVYGYEAPLEFAVTARFDNLAMLLLDHGAKVAGVADGALWYAVYYGKHDIALKMLANGEDPEDSVPAGSPLTAAVDKHDVMMVRVLLEHGANPDWEANHTDGTPIDHARRKHQTTILRMLIAARKRGNSH